MAHPEQSDQLFKQIVESDSIYSMFDEDWRRFVVKMAAGAGLSQSREFRQLESRFLRLTLFCAERKIDGSFLFRHRCKEYTFDDSVNQTLRRNTLEYKSAFTEIAGILEPA